MSNEHMAVDPANHRIVGIGNPDTGNGGLRFTLDGGDNWANHPDIPSPTAADRGMAICFDPDSEAGEGYTGAIYGWSYGSGITRSETGILGRFPVNGGRPND